MTAIEVLVALLKEGTKADRLAAAATLLDRIFPRAKK